MANPWFRLWSDMVNDPKWRTIARVSKQKIGDVIAVYVHMMTCASNATERGRTEGWNDEDVATALDIGIEQVTAIREAMQGRVLEGDYLSGWEKRQPLKEDGSAERSKAWRQAQKAANEHEQTTPNETERPRTQEEIREEEIREEKKEQKPKASAAPKKPRSAKTPLPDGFCISDRVMAWAVEKGYARLDQHFENFVGACKAKGYTYADWDEGFMGAIRNDWAKVNGQPRASPDHPTLGKAGQVTAANAQKWLENSDVPE